MKDETDSETRELPVTDYDMYSWYSEVFYDGGRDECFRAMIAQGTFKEGQPYRLARSRKAEHREFIQVEALFENAVELAYDKYGDLSEWYLSGVSDEKLQQLKKIITDWMDEHIDINFYQIDNITSFKLTQEDIYNHYRRRFK